MKYFVALIISLVCLVACKMGNIGRRGILETERMRVVAVEQSRSFGFPVMDVDDYVAKADSAFAADPNPRNCLWEAESPDILGTHEEALNFTDTIPSVCKDDGETICKTQGFLCSNKIEKM